MAGQKITNKKTSTVLDCFIFHLPPYVKDKLPGPQQGQSTARNYSAAPVSFIRGFGPPIRAFAF